MNAGSIYIKIGAKTAELDAGIRSAQKKLSSFSRSTKVVSNSMDDISRKCKRVATGFAAITAAFGAVSGASVKVAGEFERAMVKTASISRATTQEFKELRSAALSIRDSEYAPMQVADGMTFMAMAGFEVNQTIEAMPSVLQLATAGMMDLGTAADITTNILTGYGMEVEDLAVANDVLVSAMTGANVDLQMLGESFKYAGPVAKGAGLAFEETAAIIAMMGNAGFQGSMSGTALRTAISRLLNPTASARRILGKLNVQTKTASGEMRSMTAIVSDLERAGATTADMLEIFGDRAGPAMAALVSQGSGALTDFTNRLRDSEGTAARIEQDLLNTWPGQWNMLKSQIQSVAITIGDDLLPYAKALRHLVSQLIGGFQGLDKEQRMQIMRWGVIAGGVLGVITAFTLLVSAGSLVVKGLGVIGSLLSILTSPWLIAGIAITAVALGIWTAWDQDWLGLKTTITGWADAIGKAFEGLKTWWETSDFGKVVRDAWGQLVETWTDEKLSLPQKVLKTVSIVANTIADLVPAIRDIWDTWTDEDLSLGQKVVKTVSIVANSVADLITSINQWWVKTALKLERKGAMLLGLNPEGTWLDDLLQKLNDIWFDSDLSFEEKTLETIKLAPGGEALVGLFNKIKDIWINEDLSLKDKVLETVTVTVDAVPGLVDSITQWWVGTALKLERKAATLMGLDPEGTWLDELLVSLNDIWADEDLSLERKVLETIELMPGGKALTGFFDGIKSIWHDEELTLKDKTIATVKLTVGTVKDITESINKWWLDAALKLERRGAELLGLKPDELWIDGFLVELNNIWNDSELSFDKKVLETINLFPGGKALTELFNEVKAIWVKEDLSLSRKVVDTVQITVTSVTGLVESINAWWAPKQVELADKTAVFMGLDPDKTWFVQFSKKLDAIWADPDNKLEFSDKMVESFRLIPGVSIVENFIKDLEIGFGQMEFGPEFFAGLVRALTNGIRSLREKLVPVKEILRDWERDAWKDMDLSEAFRKGMESDGVSVDTGFVQAILSLGGSMADLLSEAFLLAFDLGEIIIEAITGALSHIVTSMLELGAQMAGSLVEGIKSKLPDWLKNFLGIDTTEEMPWSNLPAGGGGGVRAGGEELATSNVFLGVAEAGTTPRLPLDFSLQQRIMGTEQGSSYEDIRREIRERQEATKVVVEPRLSITPEELQLIARMVQAEAEGESFEGQVAVASVIINRVLSKGFPNSVEKVLSQKNQFEPFLPGGRFHQITEANTSALKAVEEALKGWDPSGGAMYFYNAELVLERNPDNWVLKNTTPGKTIGGHTFAFASGTPWTGHGSLNEVAGVVHKQEAVIPWKALKKGPAGVLEFLGVPGFQSGKGAGSLADIPGIDPNIAVGLEQQQSILDSLNKSLAGIPKAIFGAMLTLFDLIKDGILTLAEGILGEERVNAMRNTLNDVMDKARELMKSFEATYEAAEQVAEAHEQVVETVMTPWQVLKERVGDWVQNAKESILDFRMGMKDNIASIGRWMKKSWNEQLDDIKNTVATRILRLLDYMGAEAQDAGDMLKEFETNILESLSPTALLADLLDELAGPVRALLIPLTMVVAAVAEALLPVFEALFPIMKFFAIALLETINAFAQVWNFFATMVKGLTFGFINLIVNTDALRKAGNAIRDLTWEEALAKAGLIDKINETTSAMHNVPAGFKVATRTFQVASPRGNVVGGQAQDGNATLEHHTHVHLEGDVFGMDDLDDKIKTSVNRATRESRLVLTGHAGGGY